MTPRVLHLLPRRVAAVLVAGALLVMPAVASAETGEGDVPLSLDVNCTGVLEWGTAPGATNDTFDLTVDDPLAEEPIDAEGAKLDDFSVSDLTCLPRDGWHVQASLTPFTAVVDTVTYTLDADLKVDPMNIAVPNYPDGEMWMNGSWSSGKTFVFDSGSYGGASVVANNPNPFDAENDGRGETKFEAAPWDGTIGLTLQVNDLNSVADATYSSTLTFTLTAGNPV